MQWKSSGSVVEDKRDKVWRFYWWEDGKRKSKAIGPVSLYPTKTSAWRASKDLRDMVEQGIAKPVTWPTVALLVKQYREEKMPSRINPANLRIVAQQSHRATMG